MGKQILAKVMAESSRTSGQSLRLEAIKIKLNNAPSGINLKYQYMLKMKVGKDGKVMEKWQVQEVGKVID